MTRRPTSMEPLLRRRHSYANYFAVAGRLPGVEEIALGDLAASIPLNHDRNPIPVGPRRPRDPEQAASLVEASMVTPDYFHLLGMTLLRGRLFGEIGRRKSAPASR